MTYLEEQTDEESMINCIKNGDQLLPRITQVSIARTSSTEQPHLKDKSTWSDQEKKIQKIDRPARSLLIQGLSNDIYSLIDSNKTAKDLWDAIARHMLGSEYGEQDRKATVLYEYETFKATEGELLLDTYIRYLQVINDLKKCGYSKDNCELNFYAFDCNNARNALCNARMNASIDVNDLFVFDDMSIRKSHVSNMPFRKKPCDSLNMRSKRCSKHMTGYRALLTNFIEKFLGTVHFGNNDFAVIAGYGDVVIGSMTIKKFTMSKA
nr:hypothetical protein [Tanacetum cinerariifolium]